MFVWLLKTRVQSRIPAGTFEASRFDEGLFPGMF